MQALRLDTERLTLVPISLELVEALADPAAAARLLDASVPAGFPSPDLADLLPAHAARLREDPGLLGFGPWVAVARDERIVVGDGGFVGPPDGDGALELGYGVDAAHRGRGYATELAAALLAWGLMQPGVARIVARCEPGNAASVRVLEKLRLRRAGERGGQLLWET